jgi:pilus assembly protein CpaF
MEAVEIIRAEVRDLIRMRGIDPRSDARPTADLID